MMVVVIVVLLVVVVEKHKCVAFLLDQIELDDESLEENPKI